MTQVLADDYKGIQAGANAHAHSHMQTNADGKQTRTVKQYTYYTPHIAVNSIVAYFLTFPIYTRMI